METCAVYVCSGENLHGRQVFEAQSKQPASKKTDFPVKHEFVSWEYTHHDDGSSLHGQGVEVLPSGAVRIHQVPQSPQFIVLCISRIYAPDVMYCVVSCIENGTYACISTKIDQFFKICYCVAKRWIENVCRPVLRSTANTLTFRTSAGYAPCKMFRMLVIQQYCRVEKPRRRNRLPTLGKHCRKTFTSARAHATSKHRKRKMQERIYVDQSETRPHFHLQN